MLNKQDIAIIRGLAAQLAEIAALPVQEEKRKLWRKLNAKKPDRPMVMIDQVCWNEMTTGDEMTLRLTCPNTNCQGINLVPINLEDLPVTPYPTKREFTCTLPGSGQVVRFGYLDGHKEKRLAALPEATIAQGMLIRILDIDGTAPNKKTVTEMSLKDCQALRQAMLAVDGGVETTVDTTCEHCGQPIRARVEGDADFFFPRGH